MNTLEEMFGETPLEKEQKKLKDGAAEFRELDEEAQAKKINQLFQNVFSTEDGRTVLGIILEDLYYFSSCTNDEARALNNYAKTLISQRLGFNDNKKKVDRLFN